MIDEMERECLEQFKLIDDICFYNSEKVLKAFQENSVSETHFNSTTGYGYNDTGRDVIEKVFAKVFKAEDAIVRNQFISGSHALSVTLFALLRPNDVLLSITGKPYDTLDEVIGIVDNPSSLKSFNVKYEQIDLIDNDFDYKRIEDVLKNKKIKVIEIQRSKGYSTRKSITIGKLEKVIKFIKNIDSKIIIMIDNCYCEFANGAYVVGSKDLIKLVGERLSLPGEGKEVGPSLGINKYLLQGLFFAPSVVASSLKTAVLASKVFENLGYDVEPKYNEERADIVQNIIFHNEDKLIKFCQGIQAASPIDSYVEPIPWDMPGYQDKVIMAAGTFTQGSSIELSCDGPIREPYIAYLQGSLMYTYGKLAIMKALEYIK